MIMIIIINRYTKKGLIREMSRWIGVSHDREKSPGAPDAKISPPKLPPNFSICPNDFSLNEVEDTGHLRINRMNHIWVVDRAVIGFVSWCGEVWGGGC